MTWIKLNDNAPRHPKIAALSDRGFRVWIHSLCYAAEFLTDGIIPVAFLVTVQARVRDELLDAGLWRLDGPGCVVTIHDYLKHQTSKATIEAERRRNAARRTAGTTPGTPMGVPRKNRDQNTEVQNAHAVHPQTPSIEGAHIRVRREHREDAKAILKARLGYCQHEPQCLNQVICLDLIAHELAEKAKAS